MYGIDGSVFLWLIIPIVLAVWAYSIAKKKGRSALLWAIVVFLIPLLFFVILLLNPVERIADREGKIQCPACREWIFKDAELCRFCGKQLNTKEIKKCPYCGGTLVDGATACSHCNKWLPGYEPKGQCSHVKKAVPRTAFLYGRAIRKQPLQEISPSCRGLTTKPQSIGVLYG